MKYIVKFTMIVTLDIPVCGARRETQLVNTPLCLKCSKNFTLVDCDTSKDVQVLEIDEEL